MPSPAAQKFINVIEAMNAWPINTTVVEVAGQALSLKAARTLVKELRALSMPTPVMDPAPIASKPETKSE